MSTTATAATTTANPLLVPSPLPFGFPPFDVIKPEHYGPAFEVAIASHMAEVEAIAHNQDAATFENTIEALEKAGQQLTFVASVFFNLSSCHTNDTLKALELEMAPKLAAHKDAISMHPTLYPRIKALVDRRAHLSLNEEADRLLWRYNLDFVRAGAQLAPPEQETLKALNEQLATVETTFSQRNLQEMNTSAVWFEHESDLAGLPSEQIEAAKAAAAASSDKQGPFLVKVVNTSGQPQVLDSMTNRPARQKILAASLARGSRGGTNDTRSLVVQMAVARAKRAQLLGFPHHAAYQLSEQTIGDAHAVNKLLTELVPAAVRNAKKEAAAMQQMIDAEFPPAERFTLGAADWDLYAERVRRRDFDFDESLLKPYFELDRVVQDGVFWAATRLYGLQFVQRTDLPVYEPSVKVYNVFEEDGKSLVALLVCDWFARDNKKGGAWMSDYVSQSSLLGVSVPTIAVHLNVPPKTDAGKPSLLGYDEVKTLFHEFGHALHGMLSRVTYPRFSGTNVPTDFVEFPSQINEMWALWPEVLQHYARHHETNEPMPDELAKKAQTAEQFNQGYRTTEYLAASLLDQGFHQLEHPAEVLKSDTDVSAHEERTLAKHGLYMLDLVPPRYRTTYFAHIWSSDSYSAKYYAYLWSEVMDADGVEWFRKNGGLTRANGERMRQCVLCKGGSVDPLKIFRSFVGCDPYLQPLLVRRGLV